MFDDLIDENIKDKKSFCINETSANKYSDFRCMCHWQGTNTFVLHGLQANHLLLHLLNMEHHLENTPLEVMEKVLLIATYFTPQGQSTTLSLVHLNTTLFTTTNVEEKDPSSVSKLHHQSSQLH